MCDSLISAVPLLLEYSYRSRTVSLPYASGYQVEGKRKDFDENWLAGCVPLAWRHSAIRLEILPLSRLEFRRSKTARFIDELAAIKRECRFDGDTQPPANRAGSFEFPLLPDHVSFVARSSTGISVWRFHVTLSAFAKPLFSLPRFLASAFSTVTFAYRAEYRYTW